MTKEKLKRISLGIIAFLILVVVFIFAFRYIPFIFMFTSGHNEVIAGVGVVILGLYLVAKILIEIFK
jgi:hypothetical protein